METALDTKREGVDVRGHFGSSATSKRHTTVDIGGDPGMVNHKLDESPYFL